MLLGGVGRVCTIPSRTATWESRGIFWLKACADFSLRVSLAAAVL